MTQQSKGTLVVFTGPSGVGKGTVLKEVFKKLEDLTFSISATTRTPRPGEINGVNYHFKTKEEFETLIKNDEMLEWAQFANNYYGTFKSAVLEQVENGQDVILEIEVQGAMQVKKKLP